MAHSDMRADKPFRKSFVCGGILFALLVSFVAVTDAKGLRNAVVIFFGITLLIALATGTWGFFSKKAWSWGRFVATIVGFFLAYAFGFAIIIAIVAAMTERL
jgi:hypothetical protein